VNIVSVTLTLSHLYIYLSLFLSLSLCLFHFSLHLCRSHVSPQRVFDVMNFVYNTMLSSAALARMCHFSFAVAMKTPVEALNEALYRGGFYPEAWPGCADVMAADDLVKVLHSLVRGANGNGNVCSVFRLLRDFVCFAVTLIISLPLSLSLSLGFSPLVEFSW